MSTCHQKQFQAINKATSHVHILDPGKKKNNNKKKKSSSKATLRLERVILKWGMCFSAFINTQKALVKHLNDWLLRQIIHETEETEDGAGPSLPSDLGAPPIFGVCNNWYNAIDKVSETGVSEAISSFASCLHQLHEKLEEEKALRARVKHLLKDYQHRLRRFCKKNVINPPQHCLSFINIKASEDFEEDEIPLLRGSDENLATSRQRLVEHRKRHQEVIKHVNDTASCCLQEGLTPIFYALWNFSLENLKIYEQLRVPNTVPHE